jgi:hypothetical protein
MSIGENWFPQIESLHVIALSIVAGTIFIVDFRLLGLASRNLGVTYLSERLLPWTWIAFIGAVVTGLTDVLGQRDALPREHALPVQDGICWCSPA